MNVSRLPSDLTIASDCWIDFGLGALLQMTTISVASDWSETSVFENFARLRLVPDEYLISHARLCRIVRKCLTEQLFQMAVD